MSELLHFLKVLLYSNICLYAHYSLHALFTITCTLLPRCACVCAANSLDIFCYYGKLNSFFLIMFHPFTTQYCTFKNNIHFNEICERSQFLEYNTTKMGNNVKQCIKTGTVHIQLPQCAFSKTLMFCFTLT